MHKEIILEISNEKYLIRKYLIKWKKELSNALRAGTHMIIWEFNLVVVTRTV